MLSPEQVLELKKQLSDQIRHLPPEKRIEAEKQIKTMSPEALELMLQEQTSSSPKERKESKGIFRMIIAGEIPSKIIAENSACIAVLEIKPLSKGHTIIIPKSPIITANKIPSKIFTLAKRIAKKIEKKLKASSVEIQTEIKFGEQIINVIPNYTKSKLQRYDASDIELTEVYNKIKIEKVTRAKKVKKVPSNSIVWKRRIP